MLKTFNKAVLKTGTSVKKDCYFDSLKSNQKIIIIHSLLRINMMDGGRD